MSTLGPYELNTIVTGDARELSKAIPDESVDLIFTDPPFGIGHKYKNGYDDDPGRYFDLIKWVISECQRVVKPDGYCFIYQHSSRLQETWPLFPPSRIFVEAQNFHQVGVMDNPLRLGVDYGYTPIVFWRRTPADTIRQTRDWFVANTANTSWSRRTAKWYGAGRPLDSVLSIVDKFSSAGDIVVDFFGGSGTTAVACKDLGRRFLLFEQDTSTADMARERVRSTQPPLFVDAPQQLTLDGGLP